MSGLDSWYTYANNNVWWYFASGAPPGIFGKLSPADEASNISSNSVLSWQVSNDATSYEYCYDTIDDGFCNGIWTNTTTNTSIGLSGLSYNATYYWQVRARNATGTSYADANTWWSFTTAINSPGVFNKTAPTNGTAGVSTSPTLSWGTSTGATSYEYCYDTTNDNACSRSWASTGTNTSVSLSSLSNNTTFYWQVRAVNTGGTTYANANTWWSLTTTVNPPGPFNKSSPANGATGILPNPTLSWGTSSGAASYEYCYDTSNNGLCDGSWTSVETNTSASLSGLAAGTTYYWQVRANNAGGMLYADGTWFSFKVGTSQQNETFLPLIRR